MQSIMEDPLFAEYLSKNSIKETDRKFCRHTFQHLVDVARITYIQMLESGDIKSFCEEKDINMRLAREIIYAAALLHDIGRWKEYETGEDHAAVSA
ncbi:MAG: HD domain-containing protein, partial [Eubacteriales bacterium]